MRNFREEMMRHVVRRDVVEKVRADNSEVTVYCRCSTTEECPGVRCVLGNGRVRMVKIGYHDDPVVEPGPRHDVDPEDQFKQAEVTVQVI